MHECSIIMYYIRDIMNVTKSSSIFVPAFTCKPLFQWYAQSKEILLLLQANGCTCADFGSTHPIDGLFWSLPIYLLGFCFQNMNAG